MSWVRGEIDCPVDSQITREIGYFMSHYAPLRPTVFLSYEREAFYERAGSDFRVTFDDNILARQSEASLCADVFGRPVLPEGKIMMEIKCSGAIPLWMVKILSHERIYKTPFSKYGTAYREHILPLLANTNLKEAIVNA